MASGNATLGALFLPGTLEAREQGREVETPMKTIRRLTCPALLLLLLLLLVLVLGTAVVAVADDDGWVAESNRHAQLVLETLARFEPEEFGKLGVPGVERDVTDLRPEVYEREQKALRQLAETLRKRLADATHPKVRQDLEILIEAMEDWARSAELRHEHLLDFIDVGELVFNGIQFLLDPQIPEPLREAAPVRLRRYTGREKGYPPIVELAKERTQERFPTPGLVGPYAAQIEQALANVPHFVTGIRKLLEDFGMQGNDEALSALEQQLNEYEAWVRMELLPRCRPEARLPEPIYADNLREVGVEVDPRALIRRARMSFQEIRNEMDALAPLVARERGWKQTGYRDVIRALKKEQLEGDAILTLYRSRIRDLEAIVKREKLATLPGQPLHIRLATEAESAALPAPHLKAPRLVGNTGEHAEFILPLRIPGRKGDESELTFDDFTFAAAAWTLTVHEGRPGHEMQFASMLETGVSTARMVFAFNSVNVEGWALYAEAITKPYMPLAGQLISLQHRLLRASRAMLDPMINLGEIEPEQAEQFLVHHVVLSPAMARQEVDRYSFRWPGQATSYYYGYSELMEIRAAAELALGEAFDQRAFHDFILTQGLLPLPLLREAVMRDFVPAHEGG